MAMFPRDDDPSPVDLVFRTLCDKWVGQIEESKRHKKKAFGEASDEILGFYNGPRDWFDLMGLKGGFLRDDDTPDPMFRVSINKAFEYVSLFGPALYFDNPVRTVKPRMPVEVPPEFLGVQVVTDPTTGQVIPTPEAQQYMALVQQEQARAQADGLRANLVGAYLNWTPREFGLSAQSREAVEEALIKGRSCLWTELHKPPGGGFTAVRSTYDSVDNLLIDPDATSLRDAQWIARRCVHPTWQVERDYGLKPGSLRSNAESYQSHADVATDDEARERSRQGKSNDLLVYYKVWSKMGIGGRLPGMRPGTREPLEVFGDYAYVVVAKDVPYFLNLPPELTDKTFGSAAELQAGVYGAVAWPTPYWAFDGDWPVSCLDFFHIPNSPWPMPPLAAAKGELRFLNWAYSFLAGHVKNTSRDFVVVLKTLAEEVKTAILTGKDLEMLEIDPTQGRSIDELVKFLQHPPLNADVLKVIDLVERAFDKRTGLTELMYGTTNVAMRSAQEASMKQNAASVRPDDMAKQVEEWQARVAAKEAVCARYHLAETDVEPVLGGMASYAWGAYVATRDIHTAARQLEYQIESGSTQKPNKAFEQGQMTEAVQVLAPLFQTYSQATGDLTPLNSLISDFAKSRDLDPARYTLQAPLPPPQPDQPAGGPGAAQQEPTDNPPPQG